MARATIDDSDWPLVVAVTPAVMSSVEYAEYLDQLAALLGRRQRFGLLVDSSRLLPLSALDRQRTAAFLREVAPRAQGLLVGAAVVLGSPVQRG
ncbi:MAG TPA: hypothetical protein VGI39_08875, partial [Polyangiaceae bacterium]